MPFTTLPTSAYSTLDATKLTGNLPAISGASLTGVGISGADMWRLDADLAGSHNPLSSNLERVDDASFEKIGTGMSVSSGIWTFPSTGIWHVKFIAILYANNSSDYVQNLIHVTQNNSSYDIVAQALSGAATGHAFNTGICECFVDVTDTANVKVKFVIDHADTSNKIRGQSGYQRTSMTFIRLGDT